jgi:hypothetical protein
MEHYILATSYRIPVADTGLFDSLCCKLSISFSAAFLLHMSGLDHCRLLLHLTGHIQRWCDAGARIARLESLCSDSHVRKSSYRVLGKHRRWWSAPSRSWSGRVELCDIPCYIPEAVLLAVFSHPLLFVLLIIENYYSGCISLSRLAA